MTNNTRKQNNAPEERKVNACIENGFIFSAAQLRNRCFNNEFNLLIS